MDKMKLRPRTLKMKEVMDLILNANDSDFGESDSDDEDYVENSCVLLSMSMMLPASQKVTRKTMSHW